MSNKKSGLHCLTSYQKLWIRRLQHILLATITLAILFLYSYLRLNSASFLQNVYQKLNYVQDISTGLPVKNHHSPGISANFTTAERNVLIAPSTFHFGSLNNSEDGHLYRDLYHYKPPISANITTIGKRFNNEAHLMESIGIPITELVNLSSKTVTNFIFVTAASSNHFAESLDAIATNSFLDVLECRMVQHNPQLAVIYFISYTPWEALLTNPGVMWMDSSVRLFTDFSAIYPQLLDTDGFLQFWHSPHSNAAVTHPDEYLYMPTNEKKQENVPGRGAAAIIFFKTKKVYWSLFYWWVMCALDVDCIAPEGSALGCSFSKYGKKKYAHCHRYDQAALNVLSSNLYGYKEKVYTATDQSVLKLIKHATSLYKVKHCPVKG
ncbi:hypothetical protein LSH36_143g04045 [Paralvinella palmiformis]|uniref:Uncharacterized protein n=1 Tax=Paralvinella palmiformis TaxID=53620 RepID=A0AAD9NAD4_9ANNE|nr:hypothetical protein LSH36_143g04045 [Paralvinella palmiformis]